MSLLTWLLRRRPKPAPVTRTARPGHLPLGTPTTPPSRSWRAL